MAWEGPPSMVSSAQPVQGSSSETGTVLRDQGVVVRNGLGFAIAVMRSPGHSSLSCPSLVQHKNSPSLLRPALSSVRLLLHSEQALVFKLLCSGPESPGVSQMSA